MEKNEIPQRSRRIAEKNENIRVDVGTLQRHSEEALQQKKRNNEISKEAPRHSKRGGLFGLPVPAPSLFVFGQQAPAPAMGGGLFGGRMPAQPASHTLQRIQLVHLVNVQSACQEKSTSYQMVAYFQQ